ncbi:MAG: VOC family protein [Ginsengibacter sp.]
MGNQTREASVSKKSVIQNDSIAKLQKITPNLWFDKQAEDAARFYTSIFKNSRIGKISRYGTEGVEQHGMPEGTVMVIEFELEGQKFTGLNGGLHFKFSEAISFIINCETQEEVDYYWNKLSEDGDPKAQMCGWLKDKFGLSWQIVPLSLSQLMSDPDREKAGRVMNAMLKMKKIDIKGLKDAYDNK